ncbi:CubicO group peptidase, beta-lactamase class C family [Sinosporangium album]|uniref:CubicO group peptidase, beta-lactamase class C family n=1 Tax=Sinosporangium album TaxID=504805 RepID=A0A1G7SYL2_9ACTN|nr:serine hydrolase domain-containing protein [Sinosporangium album]SDG28038.1 CubicO group peptidase, beta-lactamase class C family [Sinosporangium album]
MTDKSTTAHQDSAALAALLANAVPKVCSAAVALIAVDGKVAASAAVGEIVRFAGASEELLPIRPPAGRDAIFDLASITKLFTTTVIMSLVEDGGLDLDTPVSTWLLNGYGGHPQTTLRHLLTHTAGLPPSRRADKEIPGGGPDIHAKRLERVLSTEPVNPLGHTHLYSDVGMVTAGRVAELAGKAPLDDLVHKRITRPLGLNDTFYRPSAFSLSRIVATEHRIERPGTGCVRGEVHDETAYGLGGVAGHAGLFSTADDLLTFAEALRTGGAPLLTPDSVAEMTRDHGAEGAPYRQALGFRLGDPAIVGPLTTAYGHSGFTGTSLVIDPVRALTVILLTNNVHPLRDRPGIRSLRHAVATHALRLAG